MKKIVLLFLVVVLLQFGGTAQLLTQSFDGATFPPTGWTNAQVGGGTDIWARATVTTQTSPNGITPHSGAGMALYDSYNYLAGESADLATPVLNFSSGGPYRVTFWMYRDQRYTGNNDSLEVFVNATSPTSAGGTKLGGIWRHYLDVPAQAAVGWYQYSFNIPGSFNTATNYIVFRANSDYGTEMVIDDVVVEQNLSCSGTPVGGTASASPNTLCSTGNSTISLSGASSTPGITYQWQSSPAGANTFADIGGANSTTYNAVGIAASTDYRCRVTCTNGGGNVNSTITTVSLNGIPANDAPCGAIALTLGGGTHCGNTTCATSSGDPTLVCSTPNNSVWYTYTPSSNGTAEVKLSRNGGASGQLNAWVQFYTATGSCPTLTLTQVNTSTCTGNVDLTTVATGSLVSPSLTAGTTYYIMVEGFSGSFGAYCIELVPPPPPPGCVTNVTPLNGATGVTITTPNAGATITWNAEATATSYDIYFGTVNPPTVNIGNLTAPTVTVNVTGLAYDTTYYWYVVPKNSGGAATGCNSNTTSFTVQSAPAICTPLTTSGCTVSDRIDIFRLKGESSQIDINTGITCSSNSYVDSTDYATVIDLARGKTYWGQIKAGTTGDYVTIWLDANDNGQFENTERLINNIPVLSTGTGTNINLFIPLGTALGNHRLRARLVYYGATPPTALTLPCGFYTYSDTRDYLVNITAGGASYTVSTYASAGACYTGAGQITIDAASNNNSNYVPLVDSLNALIAQLYPQGNDLGTVTTNYYKHNAAVRQDPGGRYYLDRNLTITVSKQPTTSYNLRFPYQNSELNALIAQPGSGITSQFDLVMTKNPDACLNAIGSGWPGLVFFPTGFGSISGDRFVDVTNITGGFSSFYLHGGSTAIPVKVEYFTGAKQGSNNLLDWKVSCTNTPSATLTLERSADSRNFASVYSITATALRCLQPFSYIDTRALPGMNYYRLKMTDASGVVTYSAIVALLNKDKGLEIVNITPNPVTEGIFKLNISSSNQVKMDVIITDLQGRVIQKNNVSLTAGFNALDMKVNNLAKGTYNIYGITTEGRTRTLAFVKQ